MLPWLLASWYKGKHRFQRFRRASSIPAHSLTLDIGSGDSPFAAADVICEKFPWDDRERTAGFRQDRPLVVGDIESLPFRDQIFDFVHCSHVLEHTVHPGRAIEELMRVGKRGYIEVPTSYFEKAARSYGGHLWYIRLENGTLVFRPKSRGVLDTEVNEVFEQKLLEKDPLYNAFHYGRLYELFHIGMSWEGKISYRVEGEAPALADFEKGAAGMSHGVAKPPRPSGAIQKLKSAIRRRRRREVRLEVLCACPRCKGPLEITPTSFLCKKCDLSFKVRAGVPILLDPLTD